MSKAFIDRSQNQNTSSNHSNELQKKIDPQAQLDWINNQKVDQGFGVFDHLNNKINKKKSEEKIQGWDYTKDEQGNVNISVNVNFMVDDNLNLTELQIQEYKKAISNQFNDTFKTSFGDKYSGSVTFEKGVATSQLIPSFMIYGKKHDPEAEITIGGMSSNSFSLVNLYKKDGSFMPPDKLAITAVHELLHTLRLAHPFEKTQGNDTKLIHQGGNNYSSTPETDPNILYNIMSYSLINIDGKSAEDMEMTLLTNDQLELIKAEIDLQKQGYGLEPAYDDNLSIEEMQQKYKEFYLNYWNDTPGEDVEKKK